MTIDTAMKVCTVAGLIFGIAGAVMLWRYGLPADVRRGGVTHLITEQVDDAESELAERYDWLARIAIGMLVGSFVLQLIPALYAFCPAQPTA